MHKAISNEEAAETASSMNQTVIRTVHAVMPGGRTLSPGGSEKDVKVHPSCNPNILGGRGKRIANSRPPGGNLAKLFQM